MSPYCEFCGAGYPPLENIHGVDRCVDRDACSLRMLKIIRGLHEEIRELRERLN